MIVFSSALVLEGILEEESSLWPLFLWDNLVTISNIAADEEDADFPITNVTNPQTTSLWKATTTGDQSITITLSGAEEVDCIGIARHNFGTGNIVASIEGMNGDEGAVLEEIVGEQSLADDSPVIFLFEGDHYVELQINLAPDATIPQAAVIFVGKAMRMPTGIPPGYTPIVDALKTEVLSPLSENGEFLGDIIISQRLESQASFIGIDGDWYRETMRPFLRQRKPFFFAWSPLLHPDEVAYAKFVGDPNPVINRTTGEVDLSIGMMGLAK